MALKRSLIAAFAILACVVFAWATCAGRPYPANAGGVIDPTCTSSLPCIEYDNNGTGPGIRGISVSGNGLAGATKNHSTSTANGRAGLIGNDTGTGTFNSGVHGLSVGGTGVLGNSTSGAGVLGTSTNNDGVDGFTSNPSLTHSPRSGVFGFDTSSDGGHGNGGVVGFSTNGVGVSAMSFNYVGANVTGGDAALFLPALSIVGNSTADFIDACQTGTVTLCDAGHDLFRVSTRGDVISNGVGFFGACVGVGVGCSTNDLDVAGNVDIFGQYRKSGNCVAGCSVATTASTGRAVVTYAPMVSQPTIEDFGEAQLVNGQASVRLDPKFANVVDQRANYLVFITPEGDANVLYVTQKSPGGFTVRESHAGRSTLMFSYRIVAKPFGSHEARLPMVELPKLHSSSPKQTRRFHA